MKERLFRFKQFQVRHARSALKVGVDAVLLGAWTPCTDVRRILDVGCGCGVISLMLAQRTCPETACITAVDIDKDSVEECEVNFKLSPWPDRLFTLTADFLDMYPYALYDLIVSNPPFYDSGVTDVASPRLRARHQQALPLDALIRHSYNMLLPEGRLVLILPTSRLDDIEAYGSDCGFHLSRLCYVSTRESFPPKRILVELSKGGEETNRCPVEESLFLESVAGMPGDDYRHLCHEFYLNF